LFRTKLSFLSNKFENSYICQNNLTMTKTKLTPEQLEAIKAVKQKKENDNEIVKK